ncbi:MAG: ABC transporter ATP-binding protein [Planctomycetes bacterium]|nr:ABC transporter ATP-binding protein [Planctomycetota bacterium]
MHVSVEHVTKNFGRLKALDDVSFQLGPGHMFVVLGANGAGKTTLLRCLAGLVVPTRGTIRYDGEKFSRDRLDLRKRLYFLPDVPVAFPQFTVIDYLTMVLRIYEVDQERIEDRVVEILRDFDMLVLAYARMGTLSRGQFYKAGLAALIAVDPELWLVDEPFASGMDPNGIIKFKDYAKEAAERGRTVIYTTQILAVAEEFCTCFCLLDEGRVFLVDSAARLCEWSSEQAGGLESLFRKLRE